MCLAIPGKVIRVDARKGMATVDYEVEKREAGTLLLPNVKVGDYVLVQAKMIVQKVPAQEARQFLKRVRSA
jgi:hydrogenase assembly chaperone HypC/HupF